MIRFRFVSILLLAWVLASCAPATRTDQTSSDRLPGLIAPQVSQSGQPARIESFNPPGTGASVTVIVPVTITNPNNFPLQIHGIEFSQSLGGSVLQVGPRGLMNQPVAAQGNHSFELRLNRSLRQDTGLLTQVAQSFAGNGLTFDIEGQATYSSQQHPWHTTSGFQLSGVATSQLGMAMPEILIEAAESTVFSLEDGSVVVRVVLNIHNSGTVGYLVHAKDLVAELGGLPVASQDLPPTPVPAGETVSVAVNFMPTARLLTQQARTVLSDVLAGMRTELILRGPVAWDVLGLDSFQQPGETQLSAFLNGN